MDRPEDVEPNPVTGKVYAVMTNNSRRKLDQIDAANPRFDNTAGHIIEMSPPGEGKDADHAAAEFTWEHFILAGDPTWGSTLYGKGTSKNGWFAAPDGAAIDGKGRLWIASDQGGSQGKFKTGDGVWACDTTGDGRAVTKMFFRCPTGAEMCGPAFTPGWQDTARVSAASRRNSGSTFDTPSTRWPDFADGMPPRPSVVAITKDDGGEIGRLGVSRLSAQRTGGVRNPPVFLLRSKALQRATSRQNTQLLRALSTPGLSGASVALAGRLCHRGRRSCPAQRRSSSRLRQG